MPNFLLLIYCNIVLIQILIFEVDLIFFFPLWYRELILVVNFSPLLGLGTGENKIIAVRLYGMGKGFVMMYPNWIVVRKWWVMVQTLLALVFNHLMGAGLQLSMTNIQICSNESVKLIVQSSIQQRNAHRLVEETCKVCVMWVLQLQLVCSSTSEAGQEQRRLPLDCIPRRHEKIWTIKRNVYVLPYRDPLEDCCWHGREGWMLIESAESPKLQKHVPGWFQNSWILLKC